jgi:hypothetical protein
MSTSTALHPALSPRVQWAGTGRSAQDDGASGGGRIVGVPPK